ncbi:hypothetical protein QO010_000780 [Caulobacter ginsengisoli]|uniref:Lipoprotein n=1 Tax=Caulobacter ginsengisoli TaxID=400775 RepID=A0ABU0ILY5_9CAUL|nr:hypothetical protein [Caulobacter ginsengisoli]MDQ0463032.1 hypothetical protein [Caulobacter ginsengisoli]
MTARLAMVAVLGFFSVACRPAEPPPLVSVHDLAISSPGDYPPVVRLKARVGASIESMFVEDLSCADPCGESYSLTGKYPDIVRIRGALIPAQGGGASAQAVLVVSPRYLTHPKLGRGRTQPMLAWVELVRIEQLGPSVR